MFFLDLFFSAAMISLLASHAFLRIIIIFRIWKVKDMLEVFERVCIIVAFHIYAGLYTGADVKKSKEMNY